MSKSYPNLNRLAITCGGTGGHFYPGLSIARYLKQDGGEVKLFLGGRNVESQSAEAAKYGIESVKLRQASGSGSVLNRVRQLQAFVSGFFQSRRELKAMRADALLGMGSFTSFPAAMAALSLRIPLFLHDGNARVGKANRILSRWARHLGTAFPAVNAEAIKCPVECTGMPLRPELTAGEPRTKAEAIAAINRQFDCRLDPARPTMLIFGGSQGAAIFNRTFPEALKNQSAPEFQVIHLTGQDKYEEVKEVYSGAAFPALLLPGTSQMDLMYQACDLAVCRSGGSTVAELALFRKFAFLVPYPYAAEKHQNDNAEFYAQAGAAEIIDNSACTPEQISRIIERWTREAADWNQRAQTAEAGMPSATADNLETIEHFLEHRV